MFLIKGSRCAALCALLAEFPKFKNCIFYFSHSVSANQRNHPNLKILNDIERAYNIRKDLKEIII